MGNNMEKKRKTNYKEEMSLLDDQRRRAWEDGDYAAYSALCNESGIIDDDEAYERGLLDRGKLTSIKELQEDAEFGELEQAVRVEEIEIDDNKFGDVARSDSAERNCRAHRNLKTDNPREYAAWIVGAFLDSVQRQKGYGIKVNSSSTVNSGITREFHMNALFNERITGMGKYSTEYSTSFEESHDDPDKTQIEDYQTEQLELLMGLVSQALPDVNVVVKGKNLYVFKRE